MLDSQTGKRKWISTDPLRKDLFYWDADSIGRTSSDKVGQRIFESVLGDTTQGFMSIHAVDKLLAHANRAARTNKEATVLNKNSIYVQQRKVYAAIYTSAELKPPGILGQSGLPNSIWAFRNSGTPISIDRKQIASLESLRSFQAGALLRQVIAHETGHKLSRWHPERCATPVPREMVLSDDNYEFPVSSQEQETPASGVTPPSWTYRIRAKTRKPKAARKALSELEIPTQEGLLMDWTPDLTLVRANGPWAWADRDINALCLLPDGCNSLYQLWPNCKVAGHW